MSWILSPLTPNFEAALRDVEARRPEAREAAARRLASPEPGCEPRARVALQVLVRDPSTAVRRAAVGALADVATDDSLEALVGCFDDGDPMVRELAAVSLAQLGSEAAIEILAAALDSPHAEVRFQALVSCAELCPDRAHGSIVTLLEDADRRVRANAVQALAMIGRDADTELLCRAAEDEDLSIRLEAALALAERGHAGGAGVLVSALARPDVVFDALDALGELQYRAAADKVAEISGAILKPLSLKTAAARALWRMGDPRGVEGLREVMRAWRSEGRSYAVEIVGELRIGELAPDLLRLARRPRGTDPETLVAALLALGDGNSQAAEGLRVLAGRSDPAGAAARRALASSNSEET